MPGYLTNRYISSNPSADLEIVENNLDLLEDRVTEAEANIDDLSLNIGV